MIKALFFDVDGTLVSFDTHQVPQSAIEALRKAHASGIHIIIATGRAASDLHELSEVPYDAVVALNGSECVLRDGTPVVRKQIPEDDFRTALSLARKYGFPIALETDKGVLVDHLDDAVVALAHIVNHPVPEVVDIEKAFAGSSCCQLCFYCDEPTERKIMPLLPELNASRWHPIFADVNVKGADKATGIAAFGAYYGFAIEETMAFGDGGNDIPMLREAGVGVAMGGASAEVRSAANYVTATVDEDGISKALHHFGLV